ncbi:MAG: transporter [Prevotella sp.]|nr:transporter [Prevotella sp.]MBR1546103.1 transporter [Prevotella sp.]
MRKGLIALAVFTMTTVSAWAGGILTNTNQSVLFLKNPARDAAIGLDGVYSNPAGVVFMPEGFHLAVNWQMAHQTRTIVSTNPLFAWGKKNDGKMTKTFEGVANAYAIPSVQAAYNKGNWSIQFNFSMPGGGGVCEYGSGLGSFESAVGGIAYQLKQAGLGVEGYDVDAYMRGRQYYFGFQLGAAYKINEHWSVYGGLRMLYGDASYKARLNNIQVGMKDAQGEMYWVNFDRFINDNIAGINKQLGQAEAATAAGLYSPEQLQAAYAMAEPGIERLEALQKYSQGVNLMSIQTGFGFAPIIGVDYKIGNFNFAAKYEFNTEMKMKNHSTLDKAMEIDAINKYQDGTDVDEDAPALLTVGAQWSVRPDVRLNLGYHHYFDKNAHWYNNAQDKLSHDTNEYLAGVEWDINDKVNISAGGQITRYGLSDEYMNDMSFVVNSYSVGAGISYKVKKNITLTAAYFQTNYSDYDRTNYPSEGVSDTFTRTNRVLGLGCQLDF